MDTGLSEADGLALAARIKAHYIFALPPFLRWQQECLDKEQTSTNGRGRVGPIIPPDPSDDPTPCDMEALLLAGPMPHRVMVSIVVNPQRFPAVNLSGARALQDYLLRPGVQARIKQFRDPRSGYQLWRGAGLHNSAAALGFGRRP